MPRGKGTGLGLATVYGIVKQSSGYIWVYSEPGMGTVFKIYLPRTGDALSAGTPVEARPHAARGSETVLVVDDQALLRKVVASMLEQEGYKVLSAASPAEALALVQVYSGPLDLLVTDVILPGMNGRVFAEQLKRSRPDTKVLFVSGYTENIMSHHGQLDEGFSFLQKPFTYESLGRKVRDILDRA